MRLSLPVLLFCRLRNVHDWRTSRGEHGAVTCRRCGARQHNMQIDLGRAADD